MIKKNLIANYLGQFWASLMGFIFIPQYIRLIGIESYGLIGFFALLQTWLSLLDMGMRPTLNREMAKFIGGGTGIHEIRDLLRSVELIVVSMSFLIGIFLVFYSGWLARTWFEFENLTLDQVVQAILLMSIVAPIYLVEGIYRSALLGLQKHVHYSVLNSTLATLRGMGALLVLIYISPTIKAYFIWQLVLSLVSLCAFSVAAYSLLPSTNRKARFSLEQLDKIKRFAGGLLGISVLGTVLTQFDKVALTKFLPLADYGIYALAAVIAGAVAILIGPVTQTWFPKLSELYVQNRESEVARAYHQASQLLTVIFGSAVVVLIVFTKPILNLWTGDDVLTDSSYKLVRILTLGYFFYGLMSLPYHVQLAYGWTRLIFNLNLVFVIIFVPAILVVVPIYGVEGAAWTWTLMNLSYVIIGSRFMFKKILVQEEWHWYIEDIFKPISAALVISGLLYFFLPDSGFFERLLVILLASILSVLCAAFTAPLVREQIMIFYHFKRNELLSGL